MKEHLYRPSGCRHVAIAALTLAAMAAATITASRAAEAGEGDVSERCLMLLASPSAELPEAARREQAQCFADARIFAGAILPLEGNDSLRQLYLAYPTNNFGYPVGAYGMNIDLVPPLSVNQATEINRFHEANPYMVIFVAVRNGSFRDTGRFSGQVIGYGFYPQGVFKPFAVADLRNEDVFIPLTREP